MTVISDECKRHKNNDVLNNNNIIIDIVIYSHLSRPRPCSADGVLTTKTTELIENINTVKSDYKVYKRK